MVRLEYAEGWETPIVNYLELRILDDDTDEILHSYKFGYSNGDVLDSGENIVLTNDDALTKVLSYNVLEDLNVFLNDVSNKNIVLELDPTNKVYTNIALTLYNLKEEIEEISDARATLSKYVAYNLEFNNAIDKKLTELKETQTLLNKLLL